MNKFKTTVLMLLGCVFSHAAMAQTLEADASRIKAHLRFLSHDLLEGRDTGSRGLEVASIYIASQFEQLGLKPAGDNGTYLQRVTFRQAFLDQDSPEMTLTKGGETLALSYPKDFIVSPSVSQLDAQVSGGMVFVGYGITAPELNHNDYANLDVKGKVVVVLSGKPQSFPSEEGAHFASGYQKAKYAAENGAIGMVSIPTPRSEKARPYERAFNYLHVPRVRWLKADGTPANTFSQLKNSASLSPAQAEKLFEGERRTLQELYAQLEEDLAPVGFAMKTQVSIAKKSEFKEITSPNVVAILEGSDPMLRKEYVSYSAHHDHIGIAKTVKKDKINNGALDNASGTAVLLETARLLSLAEKPKRSILFVAVTGEEKGLLGSDYYAQNPTVPIDSIVANVNLDMPVLTYEFADIIAFGAEHSSLKKSVTEAAQRHNLTLGPDPMPDQAIFTRSDHYSFVKQGVPSVFIIPGWTAVDKEVDGGKVFGQFFGTHYHKPSDEFKEDFNWQAAVKFAEVNIQIGQTIANQKQRPYWNKDSFFGNTFGR